MTATRGNLLAAAHYALEQASHRTGSARTVAIIAAQTCVAAALWANIQLDSYPYLLDDSDWITGDESWPDPDLRDMRG
jgi:hypothetical protein